MYVPNFDPHRLSRVLGISVYNVQPEAVTSGGLHSRIYACRSEIGDLILRVCEGRQGFYTDYFPDRVDPKDWMDQKWTIENAGSVGVPAPEIIHSDRNERWVVMRRLPGTPMDSEYERWEGCPYDEKQFGGLLARLHSIELSGWGPIDDRGRTLFSSWSDFLQEAARSAMDTCTARGSLPADAAKLLEERWLPKLGEIDVERPGLLHMESLGFANILYDPRTRTITGLLDYEDCIGGDPLFEICWMRYYFEHDSLDQPFFNFHRFGEGYGKLHYDQGKLALYAPFPLLDKLRWIEPAGSRAQAYIRKLRDTPFLRQSRRI